MLSLRSASCGQKFFRSNNSTRLYLHYNNNSCSGIDFILSKRFKSGFESNDYKSKYDGDKPKSRPQTPPQTPRALEKGDKIDELLIESITFGGMGVGKLPDGLIVFVPKTLPGEKVEVTVKKCQKTFAEAAVTKVIQLSPHCKPAPCKHFGTCGRCVFQNLAYPQQLQQKQEQIVGLINKLLTSETKQKMKVHKIIKTSPLYSKNQMSFPTTFIEGLDTESDPTGDPASANKQVTGSLIFQFPSFGGLVPAEQSGIRVEECLIQTQISNEIVKSLQRDFSNLFSTTDRSFLKHVTCVTIHVAEKGESEDSSPETTPILISFETALNEETHKKRVLFLQRIIKKTLLKFHQIRSVISFPKENEDGTPPVPHVAYGKDSIVENINGLYLKITGDTVRRKSPDYSSLIWETVVKLGGFKKTDVVLHLFCSEGGLSLSIARHVQEIHGLEHDPISIKEANKNSSRNSILNAYFTESANLEEGDTRYYYNRGKKRKTKKSTTFCMPASIPKSDVIVINLPFGGLSERLLAWVQSRSPRRIVCISHYAPTLFRDIQRVCFDNKKIIYQLVDCQPIDLNPHTSRISCVCIVDRVDN